MDQNSHTNFACSSDDSKELSFRPLFASLSIHFCVRSDSFELFLTSLWLFARYLFSTPAQKSNPLPGFRQQAINLLWSRLNLAPTLADWRLACGATTAWKRCWYHPTAYVSSLLYSPWFWSQQLTQLFPRPSNGTAETIKNHAIFVGTLHPGGMGPLARRNGVI